MIIDFNPEQLPDDLQLLYETGARRHVSRPVNSHGFEVGSSSLQIPCSYLYDETGSSLYNQVS